MVRFVDGQPTHFYYSQHSGGAAYTFSAVQQIDSRPVSYVATGSHANYAVSTPLLSLHANANTTQTVGEQDYIPYVPFGILHDTTDAGVFWDVTKNYRGFWFDAGAQTFSSAGGSASDEGVDWLKFLGKWGDEQWPTNRDGQVCVASECIYSGGPTGAFHGFCCGFVGFGLIFDDIGPFDKNLGRTAVCQNEDDCTINSSL